MHAIINQLAKVFALNFGASHISQWGGACPPAPCWYGPEIYVYCIVTSRMKCIVVVYCTATLAVAHKKAGHKPVKEVYV